MSGLLYTEEMTPQSKLRHQFILLDRSPIFA